jgi:hypothetical protein
MSNQFVCQGRVINAVDVERLQSWMQSHPEWSRFRLAKELCAQWHWNTSTGRRKDFAARALLEKLEARGLITLPPLQTHKQRKGGFAASCKTTVDHPRPDSPITAVLSDLLPLSFSIPACGSDDERHFHHYLAAHHYLGFKRTVGENIKYLVRDRIGRDLACILFGSAAWKTAPRDQYIGWSHEARTRWLSLLTNNTRLLIFPWVRVPHLASHILGRIMRRIKRDWTSKYGHPIHLVETFVERDRFAGTCYQAANWIRVGCTQGRSRQDRYSKLKVPVKDIYVYPLSSDFREVLGK